MEDGGEPLAAYRDPVGGGGSCWQGSRSMRCSRPRSSATSPRRHAARLADVIDKLDRFLDPIIAVRAAEGGLLDAQRLPPARGAARDRRQAVVALVLPEPETAYRILALEHREGAQRARKVSRGDPHGALAGTARPAPREGVRARVRGAIASHARRDVRAERPLLRRGVRAGAEARRGLPGQQAPGGLAVRDERAAALLALDEAVVAAVAALKERGFVSPHLKAFVIARINPLRFQRGGDPKFDETIAKMLASASKFDAAKIEAGERGGGPRGPRRLRGEGDPARRHQVGGERPEPVTAGVVLPGHRCEPRGASACGGGAQGRKARVVGTQRARNPSSIHARDKVQPIEVGQLPVRAICHDTDGKPLVRAVAGSVEGTLEARRRTEPAERTRRMRSASARQGDRKSCPDGLVVDRAAAIREVQRLDREAIRSSIARDSRAPRPVQDQPEGERGLVVLAFADRIGELEANLRAVRRPRARAAPGRRSTPGPRNRPTLGARVPARAATPARTGARTSRDPSGWRYAASIAIFSAVRLFAGLRAPSARTAPSDGAASGARAASARAPPSASHSSRRTPVSACAGGSASASESIACVILFGYSF